jgi:hypothetical protein
VWVYVGLGWVGLGWEQKEVEGTSEVDGKLWEQKDFDENLRYFPCMELFKNKWPRGLGQKIRWSN